jgi:hypothetical protein
MKAYWGSEGIVSRILWPRHQMEWVVSCPWYPLDRRVGGPQSRYGCGSEEENSQPLPGIKPPIIQPIAQCYTAELSRLLLWWGISDVLKGWRYLTNNEMIAQEKANWVCQHTRLELHDTASPPYWYFQCRGIERFLVVMVSNSIIHTDVMSCWGSVTQFIKAVRDKHLQTAQLTGKFQDSSWFVNPFRRNASGNSLCLQAELPTNDQKYFVRNKLFQWKMHNTSYWNITFTHVSPIQSEICIWIWKD